MKHSLMWLALCALLSVPLQGTAQDASLAGPERPKALKEAKNPRREKRKGDRPQKAQDFVGTVQVANNGSATYSLNSEGETHVLKAAKNPQAFEKMQRLVGKKVFLRGRFEKKGKSGERGALLVLRCVDHAKWEANQKAAVTLTGTIVVEPASNGQKPNVFLKTDQQQYKLLPLKKFQGLFNRIKESAGRTLTIQGRLIKANKKFPNDAIRVKACPQLATPGEKKGKPGKQKK